MSPRICRWIPNCGNGPHTPNPAVSCSSAPVQALSRLAADGREPSATFRRYDFLRGCHRRARSQLWLGETDRRISDEALCRALWQPGRSPIGRSAAMGRIRISPIPFRPYVAACLGKRGAAEVFVWGSGRQCRDFIHIDDCIDFIWQTEELLPDGASLNLSTGHCYILY